MSKALTECLNFCSTFEELWDDGGETERERNKLIGEVYNFVDIPTQTVGDEDEMPLISFGTGPGIENETRWEIKEAIQSGHRYTPAFAAAVQFPICLHKASAQSVVLTVCMSCWSCCSCCGCTLRLHIACMPQMYIQAKHLPQLKCMTQTQAMKETMRASRCAGTLMSALQESSKRSKRELPWRSWSRWFPVTSCGSQAL